MYPIDFANCLCRWDGTAGELLELLLWERLAGPLAQQVDEGGAAAPHQRRGERPDHQGGVTKNQKKSVKFSTPTWVENIFFKYATRFRPFES